MPKLKRESKRLWKSRRGVIAALIIAMEKRIRMTISATNPSQALIFTIIAANTRLSWRTILRWSVGTTTPQPEQIARLVAYAEKLGVAIEPSLRNADRIESQAGR